MKINNANKIVIAKVPDEDIPSVEDIALHVESLKLHLKRGQVKDKDLADKIDKLPSPKYIIKNFSIEEIRVITETVGYLWKQIANGDILQEVKIKKAPEMLMGNYWILNKGVILNGPNHYTIIKQNMNLFVSLLDINAFAMHDRLASNPNDVIKLVLDHGGVRVFINDKQESYFQLTDETYSIWGRKKIRKYEFDNKVVKVIDKRQPYKGWGSGITVKIR